MRQGIDAEGGRDHADKRGNGVHPLRQLFDTHRFAIDRGGKRNKPLSKPREIPGLPWPGTAFATQEIARGSAARAPKASPFSWKSSDKGEVSEAVKFISHQASEGAGRPIHHATWGHSVRLSSRRSLARVVGLQPSR